MEVLRTQECLVMCPYNPSHHIRKYRMEGHLVKCRRNYPDCETATCDFNSLHLVPEPELAYHHEYCPDKKFMELAIFKENDIPSSSKILPHPINMANFPLEDWNHDSGRSYDPESYCLKNEILRKVDVQSAAKRRNFRIMERQRFKQLNVNKETQDEEEKTETDPDENDICQIMEKLNAVSVRPVIPKFFKDGKELHKDVVEEELIVKKNT